LQVDGEANDFEADAAMAAEAAAAHGAVVSAVMDAVRSGHRNPNDISGVIPASHVGWKDADAFANEADASRRDGCL
jgi:hypothetical protein